jgi:fucose 4-O-acetylase-like acetyltransferase
MVYPDIASAIKPTQANRVAWVDFAKGIGIFLVVLGHTLRGLFTYNYAEDVGILHWIDTWIYAFHMPLFFFVSGLFIQRSAQRGWTEFAGRKLGAIVYPYVIWSLLQGGLQAFTKTKPDTTTATALGNLWRIIYEPQDHFWFLYALMVITLLFWVCERIRPLWLFVGLSVALYIGYIFNAQIALVEPINSWKVFYLMRSEAIYFALGAIVVRQSWFNSVLDRASGQLLTGAALGLGLLSIGVTMLPTGLDAMDPQMTIVRALAPILAIAGLGSIVLISQAIARSGQATFLETWGKLSLQIYVAHVIFTAMLRIVTQKLFKLQDPILFLTLGTAIGIAGPIGLNALVDRLKFPYLFNWQPTRSAKG